MTIQRQNKWRDRRRGDDSARDGQGGEHDRQVRLDRISGAVEDRAAMNALIVGRIVRVSVLFRSNALTINGNRSTRSSRRITAAPTAAPATHRRHTKVSAATSSPMKIGTTSYPEI